MNVSKVWTVFCLIILVVLITFLFFWWLGAPSGQAANMHCTVATDGKSQKNGIGKTLYWAKFAQPFCEHTKTGISGIVSWQQPQTYCGVGTVGSIAGWRCDGVIGQGGPKYGDASHTWGIAKRKIGFTQCPQIPVPWAGCAPIRSAHILFKIQFGGVILPNGVPFWAIW